MADLTDTLPNGLPSSTAAPLDNPASPDVPPAPFPRRALAFLLDLALINFAYLALLAAAAAGLSLGLRHIGVALPSNNLVVTLAERAAIGWSILFIGYQWLFTAIGGQTPGKMALRIRVVRRSGEPVDPLRALWRSAVCYASLFFIAVFLVAALPPRKRALHDYLAGTHVLPVKAS